MSKRVEAVAKRIVEEIIFDLSDRRGLSGEWDMIDDDIKKEIKRKWTQIVCEHLAKAAKE